MLVTIDPSQAAAFARTDRCSGELPVSRRSLAPRKGGGGDHWPRVSAERRLADRSTSPMEPSKLTVSRPSGKQNFVIGLTPAVVAALWAQAR